MKRVAIILQALAVATIAPLRRAALRLPRDSKGPLLLMLGAIAVAYAAASVVLGKTSIGAGVVVEALEPARFWLLVKFQVVAGAVLLALGLAARWWSSHAGSARRRSR